MAGTDPGLAAFEQKLLEKRANNALILIGGGGLLALAGVAALVLGILGEGRVRGAGLLIVMGGGAVAAGMRQRHSVARDRLLMADGGSPLGEADGDW